MSATPGFRRSFVTFLVVTVVLAILGYSFFEARRLVQGPKITILAPTDGSAISSSTVTISGIAENVSFLTINDRPILTDEEGRFSERLAPAPGYAVFSVAAKDRFGRSTSRLVHITIVTY